MSGLIRTPALSFNDEDKTMSDLNLAMYEVVPYEGLHDTKGHIKNLWEALPEVLPDRERSNFIKVLDGCYGRKGKIRGADYRLSVILAFENLRDDLTEDIRELLSTLLEISHSCYDKATKRSPKSVLCLFNVTFKHAILCTSIFQQPKKISCEKLFGIYFHSLTSHLPELARIISPSSLHSENEERIFSDLNSINLATSSRKQENIRDNSIIRIQMEMKLKELQQIDSISKKKSSQSDISKFSQQGMYAYKKNLQIYIFQQRVLRYIYLYTHIICTVLIVGKYILYSTHTHLNIFSPNCL